MRKIIILIIIFNFSILNAQNESFIPPGTIALNDSLFIDKGPVTNNMFEEYLRVKKVLKKEGFIAFSKFAKETNETGFPLEMAQRGPTVLTYPITSIYPLPLVTLFYSNNKYLTRKGYGRKDEFAFHPLLNISKKQANDYCELRTDMVRHLIKYHEDHAGNRDLSEKISYRLPTHNELTHAYNFFSHSGTIT